MNDYPRINHDRQVITLRHRRVFFRDRNYCIMLAPHNIQGVEAYWITPPHSRLIPYVLAYLSAH